MMEEAKHRSQALQLTSFSQFSDLTVALLPHLDLWEAGLLWFAAVFSTSRIFESEYSETLMCQLIFHSCNGFRDFMVPVAGSLEDSRDILWLCMSMSPAQTAILYLCNQSGKNSDGFYSFSSQMPHGCPDLTLMDSLKRESFLILCVCVGGCPVVAPTPQQAPLLLSYLTRRMVRNMKL